MIKPLVLLFVVSVCICKGFRPSKATLTQQQTIVNFRAVYLQQFRIFTPTHKLRHLHFQCFRRGFSSYGYNLITLATGIGIHQTQSINTYIKKQTFLISNILTIWVISMLYLKKIFSLTALYYLPLT